MICKTSTWRAFWRFVLILLFLLVFPLIYFPLYLINKRWARLFCRRCYGGVCRLLGIRIVVEGSVPRDAHLIVSNHISYLDILILGSLTEEGGAFVAKKQIRSWPIIGWVAMTQDTVFVSRERRSLLREMGRIARLLESGKSVMLFPEGTSTDGTYVEPFKQAFFNIARYLSPCSSVRIQPVTLLFKSINAHPMTRYMKKRASWVGDLPLFPHMWQCLKHGHMDVTAIFHPSLEFDRTRNGAKNLAEKSWRLVSAPLRYQDWEKQKHHYGSGECA
jgi:1-acyl-sn-glycerol-3-phosphate acyltransferase